MPKNYTKTVLPHLEGPGDWAFLGGRGQEPQNSPKCDLQNLTRIPFQMARKRHFEAPEGMDRFWAPGPRL